MGKFDPGDTIKPRDVEANGDDPQLAVIAVEQAGLGKDDTIVNTFTDAEKKELEKMLKDKSQFNELEAAVLRCLMSNCATVDNMADMVTAYNDTIKNKDKKHYSDREKAEIAKKSQSARKYMAADPATLQDVGVVIGAGSRRTNGKPVSKPAAIKEINRILKVVAKRSKAKYGTAIELEKFAELKDEIRHQVETRKAAEKKAQFEERKRANAAAKEFYKLIAELHREERKHGIAPSEYHIDKFLPPDLNIDELPQFGGRSKNHNDD